MILESISHSGADGNLAIRPDGYRYGFQGQEKDNEIKGEGNSINYKYRMHDPRLGRFFAVDPLYKKYPMLTPFQFSSNNPVGMIELEGLEGILVAFTGGVSGSGTATTEVNTTTNIQNNIQSEADKEGIDVRSVTIETGDWVETQGDFDVEESVQTAYDFIVDNYKPGDKIVIYGYSAGGYAAVELARKLKDEYDVEHMEIVDMAMGPFSGTLDREIPTNVKRAVNAYQESKSKVGSRGYPAKIELPSSSPTSLLNWNMNERTDIDVNHGTIDEVYQPGAEINLLISLGVLDLFSDRAMYGPFYNEDAGTNEGSSSQSSGQSSGSAGGTTQQLPKSSTWVER